jgi:hypothetical protein
MTETRLLGYKIVLATIDSKQPALNRHRRAVLFVPKKIYSLVDDSSKFFTTPV